MNADNFSCIFGFQKLFMGEVLFIPWGGDYVLGITGLLAISIRVTWFINGGQLAHPTRYEINPPQPSPWKGREQKRLRLKHRKFP